MKQLLICLLSFFVSHLVFSQDPVHWTFSSLKTDEGIYEIHLTATVESPWHTYSQSTPEGGPLPTKIVFTKNPILQFDGKAKENGELKVVHDEIFGVDVKYFSGNVDFTQIVKIKAKVKTSVTGTVEFMACNDHQCLPPKRVPFTIQLQ